MDYKTWVNKTPGTDFSEFKVIQTVDIVCCNCGRPLKVIAPPQLENPFELREQFSRIVQKLQYQIRDLEARLTNQDLCLRIAERLLKERGLIL